MTFNILFILDDFPPVGMQSGIRALEISKKLVKNKINPIILTKIIEKDRIFNYSLVKQIPKSVKVFRTLFIELKQKYYKYIDPFFRFDYYLNWIPFAYFQGKKIIKKNNINLIYASAPYFHTHIIGFLLKNKFDLPLIVEYRDPWSFCPYQYKNEKWLNKIINYFLERKILKTSDGIICVSEDLKIFLKNNFPIVKKKKIISIPNGLQIFNKLRDYEIDPQKVIFVFTGSLYRERNILPLLKILSKLKREGFFNDFHFLLKIFGFYEEKKLKSILHKLAIEDLVFLGNYITREKALQEIKHSNMAVHIGENHDYPTIAFKVWDYLGCKKKIVYLGLEDSFTAKFLKKHRFGVIIPINNLIKGKKNLKNLFIGLKTQNFDLKIKEKEIVKFSWNNRTDKLLNFLKERYDF